MSWRLQDDAWKDSKSYKQSARDPSHTHTYTHTHTHTHTHTNILYQSTQSCPENQIASFVLKAIFEIWGSCQEYIMFMFAFSLPTYNMLFTQCISFCVITLEESMMFLQPTLLCNLIPPHTHTHTLTHTHTYTVYQAATCFSGNGHSANLQVNITVGFAKRAN